MQCIQAPTAVHHAPRRPSVVTSGPRRSSANGGRNSIGAVAGRKAEKDRAQAVNTNKTSPGGRTNSTRHMKTLGPYLIGKTIGEGTFGKVKIGLHNLTGEKVAVKILEKSKIVEKADVRRVTREINILKRNRHRNIIQLYEVLDTPSAIYLIMENADGGEMFDFIVAHQRVPEPQACHFFHQIVDGVEYLHLMEVTHRDLKPENLLLQASADGWVVKIVDFGLSNTHEGGQLLSTACGSPCYAAPEMIAGKRYVGPKADIWSMGVILFALVCGYLPFEDTNTSNLYKKILAGDYKAPSNISRDVRDLIHRILNTNPETRYSMADIRRHPWYCQVQTTSPPFSLSAENEPLDEEVLSQAEGLGLPRDVVISGVRNRLHNTVTATYYLLLNKRRERQEKECVAKPCTSTATVPVDKSSSERRTAAQPTAPAAAGSMAPSSATAASQTPPAPALPEPSGVSEVTNAVLDDVANTSAVAKPNVPKLSLHELNALRPHEEAPIEIVPSYQRQTMSGHSKTARPADSGRSGQPPTSQQPHVNGGRAGRLLRGPASRGSVSARCESPPALLVAGQQTAGVAACSGAAPVAVCSTNVPRAPSRPRARSVRQNGNAVRVPTSEQGCEDAEVGQEKAEEEAVTSACRSAETGDRPPLLPPGPVCGRTIAAVTATAGPPAHVPLPDMGPQESEGGVAQSLTCPPQPTPSTAPQPKESALADAAPPAEVPASACGPTQALTIDAEVGQQQQQPTPILNLSGQKQQEQGGEPRPSSTSGAKGQATQQEQDGEGETEASKDAAHQRRCSTGNGNHRYFRYVSQLSSRDNESIFSDAGRALATLEIVSLEHANFVLKCAGRGLQFKVQVKTKLPENQQYLKATCYQGQKEHFKQMCADLFRAVPL